MLMSSNPFARRGFPQRPRAARPHPFRVGEPFGQRTIVRVTTTRVLLECRCGKVNAIPIRRLEKEKPETCRACAPRMEPGTRGAVTSMSVGDRFGTRTVTGFVRRPNRDGGVLVELRCDCGHEGAAEPRALVSGRAQSCTKCANHLRGQPLAKRSQPGNQDVDLKGSRRTLKI